MVLRKLWAPWFSSVTPWPYRLVGIAAAALAVLGLFAMAANAFLLDAGMVPALAACLLGCLVLFVMSSHALAEWASVGEDDG